MITYQSAAEAARASKFRKAISKDTMAVPTRKGTRYVRIVKPLHGQPVAVYRSCPALECREYSLTTKEIDSVSEWEAF